jgi:hypothetical protein
MVEELFDLVKRGVTEEMQKVDVWTWFQYILI